MWKGCARRRAIAAPEELTAAAESEPVYDLLSYDALFANQYAYDEGGLSPENEDFQIGGKMTLEGFDAVGNRRRGLLPSTAGRL